MIDITRLNDPKYRQGVIDKGASEKDIDDCLNMHETIRNIRFDIENLRVEKKVLSNQTHNTEQNTPNENTLSIARKHRKDIQDATAKLNETLEAFNKLVVTLPNPPLVGVPIGPEEDFELVEIFGNPSSIEPQFTHYEVGSVNGFFNSRAAANTSGPRFTYVMGDAALLQFALAQFAIAKLIMRGFIMVDPPLLVKEKAMYDAGFFPAEPEQVYSIEKDSLYLLGTSEISLSQIQAGAKINELDLPLRYFAYTHCFRREAGTAGRDTRGIFRQHQFPKIEMFSIAHPESSADEHNYLMELEREIFSELDLTFRIINSATGDLSPAAAKKYDMEAWFPSEEKFRELTSCSNYTDYAARRSNIRVIQSDGSKVLVHTLNGTALAIGRTMSAIFEQFQTTNGTVKIPAPLLPYMMGKTEIGIAMSRDGKSNAVSVVLTKNEFFTTEFKGIELENIEAADKKKFKIEYGVKIKSITSENLKQYTDELKGNIILSIDNVKATDVETVSKLLNKKEENQTVRIEMINKNGEIMRVII